MRTGTSSYCCNSNDDDEQEGNDCSMRDESGRKREREKEGMKTNMKRAVTSSLSRLSRLNQLVSSLSLFLVLFSSQIYHYKVHHTEFTGSSLVA